MNLKTGAAIFESLPAHHQPFAQTYRQKGYWSKKPVPDFVADAARARADTVAVVDRKGSVSYRELAEIVRRLAAGLWMLGVRPGDAVAIQLPNWREFVFFQQAAVRIGAVYIPLLPQLRAGDLEYLLGACRAKMLVVPATFRKFDHAAMAMELRARLPRLLQVFVVDPVAPLSNGCASVEEFLSQPWESEAGAAVDDRVISPDAVRTILFTSGTESRPKGVLHSYNTLFFGLHRHVDYFGFNSDDAVLTASPVGHGTGAVNGSEFGLLIGGKVVLLDTWNAAAATELIARERCSFMWGAATFFTDLIEVPERSQYDLSSFRLALTAGAPIPPGLVAAVREKLGARLVTAYGQSEGQNIAITRPDDPGERVSGSDGRINEGIEYKLVDELHRRSACGAAGEFAYRGPNVCLGYLDPSHTARAFDSEGFIYSGDLAAVDQAGYLRIVGRRKDIIIRGGENISPAEVENLLFQHPMIRAVSVVGYPDQRLGQRACAFVVPKPCTHPSVRDLVAFLEQLRVAKFKYPERVELVDALPMTSSGKVRKEALRELLQARLAQEGSA